MSLWIPKNTGRPLWAQRRFPPGGVGGRLLISPSTLDHCENREARGRQASSMEGGPQRGRWLPGGGVPLDDGSCGGGGLGSATRRDGHKHRPALRPRSFPAGRVDPPAPAEVGGGGGAWSRGVGQRHTLPRAPPVAPQPGFPWRPRHYNDRWRSPKRQRTVGLATRPPSSMSFLGEGRSNNGNSSPTCSSTLHTATPAHADIERGVRLPA